MKLSNYAQKTFADSYQKHIKIAPKIIKNPLKIDPWRASGTPWRPYLSQGRFLDHFWLHFRPQKGLQNRQKIDNFLDLFLNDFLEPLFHAFGLHLGSQNDPKKRQKRDPIREHENHWFCCYLLHFSHIEGSKKSSFLVLFGDPFLDTFSRPLFHRFWTLLGNLLGPFGHPKSTLKNTPKKDTKKE